MVVANGSGRTRCDRHQQFLLPWQPLRDGAPHQSTRQGRLLSLRGAEREVEEILQGVAPG